MKMVLAVVRMQRASIKPTYNPLYEY